MRIEFEPEARLTFRDAVRALPTGYTIGVVMTGGTFVHAGHIVPEQDFHLVTVKGDVLVVQEVDVFGEPNGELHEIDLNEVEEIHVY